MVSTESVMGLVRNQAQSDALVTGLLHTGFPRGDISTFQLDHPPSNRLRRRLARHVYTDRSAGIGALIGTVLGLVVGVVLQALPGSNPFVGAGLTMAILAVTGAAFGWVGGLSVEFGISELEAKHYDKRIHEGAILLSIRVDDRTQRSHARRVLAGYGATHIATFGDEYNPGVLVPALAP